MRAAGFDVQPVSTVQIAPRRVADDVHVGVLCGRDEAVCAVPVQRGVWRGDHDIQFCQQVVGDRDTAVRGDVGLDAGEHVDGRIRRNRFDLGQLLAEFSSGTPTPPTIPGPVAWSVTAR